MDENVKRQVKRDWQTFRQALDELWQWYQARPGWLDIVLWCLSVLWLAQKASAYLPI